MYGAELLHRFDAWEEGTRGHTWWNYRVAIEPPYRPFLADKRVPRGTVDDARKPGLWENLTGRRRDPAELPAVEADNSPPERSALGEITELQLLVPKEFIARAEVARRCLISLGSIHQRLSFEVVGQHHQTVVQVACDVAGRAAVLDSLRAYFPEIRIRDRPNGLLDAWPDVDGWGAVLHLGLTERVFRSLRSDDRADADPLIEIVGRLASLAEYEFGLVQVLFEPTRGNWADDFVQFGRSIDAADRVLGSIEEKFREPLFAAVVRVAAVAPDGERATELVNSLAAGMIAATRSDSNALGIVSIGDHPVDAELADIIERETRRSGMLVSLSELSVLAHLPSAAVRSESLLRQSVRTRAAAKSAGDATFVIGINEHEGEERVVGLSLEDRLRHTYCIGASGTGKSTLLLSMAIQDIAAGTGFAVLDPHGDLIDDITARIPEERASDVVLFDPSDESFPVGFNVLSAHSELERTLLASDLVGVFRRFSTTFGDQMASVLGNAILAFLESSEGGTLIDLRNFLLDKSYRARFLETVPDEEVLGYWQREFPLLKGIPHASILTRLNTFLRPKTIRYMVAQKRDNLDLRRIMDTRKILLVKLSHGAIGEENAYLLGSLLVARIAQAAMSRQDEEAAKRVPFFLYMDEFQHFVTPSIAAILTGARKYGLGLVLSHQEIRQLKARSDEVFGAVLGNANARIVFRIGEQDAKTLADGFSHFGPADLQNLGIGEAIARIERPDFDFNLRTGLPAGVDAATSAARKAAVRKESRAQFATPREVVDATLREARAEQAPTDEQNRPTQRKARATAADPPARAPGRGGPQHKHLQGLIKKIAEDRGYAVTLEKTVLGGHGHVDALLERGMLRIGCEISVTTRPDHEVRNLTKCLAAGFDYAVLISDSQEFLDAALAQFEHADRRAQFLLPNAFIAFLDELDGAAATGNPPAGAQERKRREPTKPLATQDLGGKRILTASQAAGYLGFATQTLAKMRVNGDSPPFYKLGRQVMYERDDLDAWLDERRRRSTSDQGP